MSAPNIGFLRPVVAHLAGFALAAGVLAGCSELAGPTAAQDFASAGAVNNPRKSASRLLRRMDEAAVQVRAAIDNLRANGSAYSRSDVAPGAGAVTT